MSLVAKSFCNDLVPVLDGESEINLLRTFWLVSPSERRHVTRVTALWNYLREAIELNKAFLMGESPAFVWLP